MSRISIANSQVQHEALGRDAVRMHATAVRMPNEEGATLIIGAPAAGKSAYAAYLIQAGAELISDDQTRCTRDGTQLLLSPPANIAGVLAVRGLGVMRIPHVQDVPAARVLVLSPEMLHGAKELRILECVLPCSYARVPPGGYYAAHGLFSKATREGQLLSEDWMPERA